MTWQTRLTQAWLERRCLARVLWPLSWLYGLLQRRHAHRQRNQATRLPVGVIVVGNVLAGGVGKTPLVIALVQHLQQQGWRVGVISRGYGRKAQDIQIITEQSKSQEVGDEPLLIHQKCQCPVAVGSQRVAVAQALLAKHPEINLLLSDDGLQHTALHRDIEICVFDERMTGNGWLLPAGPLREPWPRPHAVRWSLDVQTQPALTVAAPTLLNVPRALSTLAHNAQGQQKPLSELSPAQALAGIAKPALFFDQLRMQGVQLQQTWALADHADMQQLPKLDPHMPVLCTEKDAVKLWAHWPTAWAVPLICPLPQALLDWLDQALSELPHERANPV